VDALPTVLVELIGDELERVGVPGLTLGLLADGDSTTAAFGTASVETGAPLQPQSVFRIASITKPFTATLAFVLADDGVLDLDEPVLEDEEITLRHLLSHQSGLDCEIPGGIDAVAALRDLDLGAVRRWAPPGDLWAYSNAAFWLAGAVIERATGLALEDAMRERVLTPLGLERTTFDVEEAIVHAPAVGHEPVGHPHAREHAVVRSCYRFPRPRRPSGGLISNVDDLLRFARAHLAERFGAMREPQVAALGCSWGLGWRIEALDEATAVLHDGGYGGFNTRLLLVPERAFALAVLTNSNRGVAAIETITDAALEHCCDLRRETPTPIVLDDDAVAPFAGRYRQDELDVTVAAVEGGLELRASAYDVSRGTWDEYPPARYVPVGARTFVFPGSRDLVDFPRDGLLRLDGRLAART
jgi:CubicO group peptidase (beta-lactamase class C family)